MPTAGFDGFPVEGVALETLTIRADLRAGTRYDDPALRFLPEIEAAAADAGIPPALLATVVRVTSAGEPAAIFPDGGVGLARVPTAELVARGIEPASWFDPATNLGVAAELLAGYLGPGGSPDPALVAYLAGSGDCSPVEACRPGYTEEWYGYYLSAVAQPAAAGLERVARPGLGEFSPRPVAALAPVSAPPVAVDDPAPDNRRPRRERAARADRADADAGSVVDEQAVTVTETSDDVEKTAARDDERDLPPLAAALIRGVTDDEALVEESEPRRNNRASEQDRADSSTESEQAKPKKRDTREREPVG